MKNLTNVTRKKKNLIAGFLYFFAAILVLPYAAFGAPADGVGTAPMRRFGIFVGSNNGGRERVMLRYAVSDARSISRVFSEMGGITADDTVLLVEPSVRDINSRIDALREQVIRSKGINKRTEIVFYYSGHSDEEGLLLNREKYSYRELRDKINNIPSDMRIVILDSCASGAFTRLKGGAKTQPFLVDSSLSAEGYAFLTSSSANEVSQESDRIAASYFTHSLVAGLRGAADSVGDGRVTLNELYRFAYAETMAKTEASMYGTQHPSYDIQVNGTGDLVLTDIKETSASMVFDEKLSGRLSIRDRSDHLVAEINKTSVRPLELGLEGGLYSVTLQRGNTLLRAQFTLADGRRVMVSEKDFAVITGSNARVRGGKEGESSGGPNIYTFIVNNVSEPFPFPLIGLVNTARGDHGIAQIGLANFNTGNFSGLQASYVNTVGNNFSGLQVGFLNTVTGDAQGLQAGFINTNIGDTEGLQVGFINTNAGDTRALQAGFINTNTGETRGFQVGFINTNIGDTFGIQAAFVNTTMKTSGIQAGFWNKAKDEMTGAQIGFTNIADKGVKGWQLGFFNYADSIENGAPVGIISIVKNGGYRAIEYGFSEFHPVTVGLKFGIDRFYTTILTAYNPDGEYVPENFATGFGIGSISPITKFFFFNSEMNWLSSAWNTRIDTQFTTLVTSFGIKLGKLSITAGPSVTWVYVYNVTDVDYRIPFGSVVRDPWMPTPLFSLYTHDINENHSIVIGARASLRLHF